MGEPWWHNIRYHIPLNPPKGSRVKNLWTNIRMGIHKEPYNCYFLAHCTKYHINDDDDDDDDDNNNNNNNNNNNKTN
jgi:hypothetical protein